MDPLVGISGMSDFPLEWALEQNLGGYGGFRRVVREWVNLPPYDDKPSHVGHLPYRYDLCETECLWLRRIPRRDLIPLSASRVSSAEGVESSRRCVAAMSARCSARSSSCEGGVVVMIGSYHALASKYGTPAPIIPRPYHPFG